jgi:hypothetical protein
MTDEVHAEEEATQGSVQEEEAVVEEQPKPKQRAKRVDSYAHYDKNDGSLVYRSSRPESRFDVKFPGGKWVGLFVGDGFIEWRVRPDAIKAFESHHFFVTQRIRRKPINV